jgi:diguanylate cyclase (GGDEF)-like protein
MSIVDGQRIPVPLSGLVDILGAHSAMSNADGVRAFSWPCGCSSQVHTDDEKIALWRPCTSHADIFIDRHAFRLSRQQERRERAERRRAKAEQWRKSFAALAAVAGSICAVDAILVLLQRFLRAEADSIIDPLTGLYNRRGWERRSLEEHKRLLRQPEATVIFMMDLDDLKIINDRNGHAAGDEALMRAAQVIMSVTRQHDIATRLGGDEFGLLATSADEHDADIIEHRLRNGFAESGLSVSIGRAQVPMGSTVLEASENADRNMYAEKRAKKDRGLRHAS